MTQQQLYRMSCHAARRLLQGLEGGNLEQVEQNLARIRQYVTLAETVPATALSGAALHRREQLEVLGGVTDSLSRTLGGLRLRIAGELHGLDAKEHLLRHLVSS